MKRILIAGFAAAALAVTGACAGDDANDGADISANTGGGDESAQEYCALSAELDSRQEAPSAEDLDRIVKIAPEEIKDDAEMLAGAIKAGEQESKEATAAADRLEAWEDENCEEDAGDNAGDGGDADEGGNSGPSSGKPGEGGGDGQDNEGPGAGADGAEGGTGAEVEGEVGGDGETTSTR